MNLEKLAFFAIVILLEFRKGHGLKLTLKQDMNRIQEQLNPKEIGQFLHSIKNLPKLAEFLDPSRSRLNFDFYFYYNNYGCSDSRLFNWKRITKILTYGGLSRADKLILLNGCCLSRWPDFSKINSSDLKYLLSVLPEINPILHLTAPEFKEEFVADVIVGNRRGWNILIEQASLNRELNFIPGIDLLFKKEIIEPHYFESSSYFNLIGPHAIDSCYQNARSPEESLKCHNFVFSMEQHYQNLSARDLFFWALNIGIGIKYQIRSRNHLFLKHHFDKLIDACPPDEFGVKTFLKIFSTKIIYKHLRRDASISNEIILETFGSLSMNQEPKEDFDFFIVEYYKWLDMNFEYFEIDRNYLNNTILKEFVFKLISKGKNIKYADYLLNLFIEKRQFCHISCFKQFLINNYDSSRPSNALIKAFRQVSWISGEDGGFKMTQTIKTFLDYDFRVSFLRKLSFDHADHSKSSTSINIFLGEDEFINTSLFNCIYESLMDNKTLVFPLKVDINTSGLLNDLVKESVDLGTILKKIWNLLSNYKNGFMEFDDFDFNFGYSSELIPNPWTHPNVLLLIGRVMTLAFLNGIKLNSWRLKKSIFKSIFKINLTSIYKVEGDRIEEFEAGHFLEFYCINDYINEIEPSKDKRIIKGLKDLVQVNESLKPQTRRALDNYRNSLLMRNEFNFYTFKSESNQIWSSKIFRFLEETKKEINFESSARTSASLFNALKPHLSELNLKPELIGEDLERIARRPRLNSSNSRITELDMARIQIYSLYLGLQPLTRFLNSDEVYEALFKE